MRTHPVDKLFEQCCYKSAADSLQLVACAFLRLTFVVHTALKSETHRLGRSNLLAKSKVGTAIKVSNIINSIINSNVKPHHYNNNIFNNIVMIFIIHLNAYALLSAVIFGRNFGY